MSDNNTNTTPNNLTSPQPSSVDQTAPPVVLSAIPPGLEHVNFGEQEGRGRCNTLEIHPDDKPKVPGAGGRIRTTSCNVSPSNTMASVAPKVKSLEGGKSKKAMAYWSCKGKGLAVFTSGGDSQGGVKF